jgi:hypothetical protein
LNSQPLARTPLCSCAYVPISDIDLKFAFTL